jgi:hypothetical protein
MTQPAQSGQPLTTEDCETILLELAGYEWRGVWEPGRDPRGDELNFIHLQKLIEIIEVLDGTPTGYPVRCLPACESNDKETWSLTLEEWEMREHPGRPRCPECARIWGIELPPASYTPPPDPPRSD